MRRIAIPTSGPGYSRSTPRFLTLGILVAVLFLSVAPGHGQVENGIENPRQVTRAVALWMQQRHLSRRFLDDQIAERCLQLFLKSLDPMKVYFYQQDVDEFMATSGEIDDQLKRGNLQLADQIFNRFLQRVDEREQLIEQLLEVEHDFTVEEKLVTDRDSLQYPKDEQEARDRWRKRIKYELLRRKADELAPEERVAKVRRRYSSLAKQWHQTKEDEILEMYLTAMTSGFDPHSSYMSPETLENFNISMRLELDGIGASLRYIDGYTVVHRIIPGGAADKDSRLKPEDKITSVGQGVDGEMADVVDMKLRDVVKLIRGKRGTVVRLGVLPSGQVEEQTYDITRARIELKDHEARSEIFRDLKKSDGTSLVVGVISLPSFYMDMTGARQGREDYKSTTRDVERLLRQFKEEGVDAVVLDLRWNGGGSLTEAINLTGLFVDQGPIVQVKGPFGRVQTYNDNQRGEVWDGPLVVLVNKFSASASEIFAGAIQDYHRGIIVGDKATHGKGTVQQLFDLGRQFFRDPNNIHANRYGALKMTIQQFYRPSGDSTQNRGVLADIELPSMTTHLDVGESDLDYALAFDEVESLPYEQYSAVESDMLAGLVMRSGERVRASGEFQNELDKIARYKEQKQRKQVTLNEDDFLAEREKLNADKEEEEEFEELSNMDRPVVRRDFYFNEALDITRDYVEALAQTKMVKSN